MGCRDALVGKVTGPRPVQANWGWNLCRVALERSSLFLSTPEASRLALACNDLNTFFENAVAEGGFWNACQFERAKISQGLIWLHPIVSITEAARFAMCAQSLRLGGGATFTNQSELRSLKNILQTEVAHAFRVGEVVDTFCNRFLFAWKFDLERIADLLENRSLREVVSDDVSFTCRHGISFALNLAVSKASFQTSELTFRFHPVRMIGEYCSSIEIKACGYIIAPDPQKSMVKLKPIFGGTRPSHLSSTFLDECDDGNTLALGSKFSMEWLNFSRLLSVVRLHLFPVSLCVSPISIRP